jgi:hypothetical protein
MNRPPRAYRRFVPAGSVNDGDWLTTLYARCIRPPPGPFTATPKRGVLFANTSRLATPARRSQRQSLRKPSGPSDRSNTMRSHYRPPPGKRSLVMTAIAALMVVGGGVYAVLENAPIATLPTVTSPDMTTSFSKSEPRYLPSPMPKTADVPAPQSKEVPMRRLGPGIYRCEDANGAVTYSDTPCGDGKLVDTKPTSSGFSENWSITVKHR